MGTYSISSIIVFSRIGPDRCTGQYFCPSIIEELLYNTGTPSLSCTTHPARSVTLVKVSPLIRPLVYSHFPVLRTCKSVTLGAGYIARRLAHCCLSTGTPATTSPPFSPPPKATGSIKESTFYSVAAGCSRSCILCVIDRSRRVLGAGMARLGRATPRA